MKTFEQFMEQVTPKDPEFNKLPVTVDDAITGRIRDLGDADKANKKFRKKTGFNLPLPLAKIKTKVKSVLAPSENQQKEMKHIDNLTYKTFVDKFNNTYKNSLKENQKNRSC